ncbi:MAG: spermidine synthase, partial [Deltaproteobacteria bacterium]
VLMTSAAHRSEDSLARLACEGLAKRRQVRVLVGGLGMAFTLRAALDALGRDAFVTVAELNTVVVRWCRGALAGLTDRAVEDPRASVVVANVADVIAKAAAPGAVNRYDAIAIDLYEGPPARLADDDVLYGPSATAAVYRALKPGGRYAVWSEKASPAFERALRSAGFKHELQRGGRGGSVHLVYLAHVPEARGPARPSAGSRR